MRALLCLAYTLTYFICTLSAFVTLWLLLHTGIAEGHIPTTAVEATWLIFLVVYSLLGITGKLPEVLPRIHLPGGDHCFAAFTKLCHAKTIVALI
jgi:hypothetical protein